MTNGGLSRRGLYPIFSQIYFIPVTTRIHLTKLGFSGYLPDSKRHGPPFLHWSPLPSSTSCSTTLVHGDKRWGRRTGNGHRVGLGSGGVDAPTSLVWTSSPGPPTNQDETEPYSDGTDRKIGRTILEGEFLPLRVFVDTYRPGHPKSYLSTTGFSFPRVAG